MVSTQLKTKFIILWFVLEMITYIVMIFGYSYFFGKMNIKTAFFVVLF